MTETWHNIPQTVIRRSGGVAPKTNAVSGYAILKPDYCTEVARERITSPSFLFSTAREGPHGVYSSSGSPSGQNRLSIARGNSADPKTATTTLA